MIDTYRKLYAMLQRRDRVYFWLLMVILFFAGAAEALGVASVLPFLALAANPDVVEDYALLGQLRDWLAPADEGAFLFQVGMLVLGAIVLTMLVRVVAMYAVAHYGQMRKYHFAHRLLSAYLGQPYVWFLTQHSSSLVRSVLGEVDQTVGSGLIPAIKLVAQSMSLVFLVGLIFVVQPVIALSVCLVLGGAYGLIFLFVRRMMTRLGYARVETNRQRFRIASEAIGGFKDVKLMGLEERYVSAFRPPAFRLARTQVTIQMVGELPRYTLEAVTFGGMIVLVLVMMSGGGGRDSLAEVIPVLGIFALAGLRMLPAIQQIYYALTQLRVAKAVVDNIHADMMALGVDALPAAGIATGTAAARARPPLALKDRLEMKGVRYSYPMSPQPVLDGLDLSVEAHTTVGLVGGTGAGKTTAIDILLGLLVPDEGEILVDGQPLTRESLRAWQDNIGYVPQQIYLIDDTVTANIAFGVAPDRVDHAAVERAARLAELHAFVVSELPEGYDTRVGERGVRLSGGQRQRIGIARALYHDPDVLILDEATSALDNITERAVMDAVRNLGNDKTIIMIAHRLSTVKNCDRIFLLEKGRVTASGSYEDLLRTSARFREMALES